MWFAWHTFFGSQSDTSVHRLSRSRKPSRRSIGPKRHRSWLKTRGDSLPFFAPRQGGPRVFSGAGWPVTSAGRQEGPPSESDGAGTGRRWTRIAYRNGGRRDASRPWLPAYVEARYCPRPYCPPWQTGNKARQAGATRCCPRFLPRNKRVPRFSGRAKNCAATPFSPLCTVRPLAWSHLTRRKRGAHPCRRSRGLTTFLVPLLVERPSRMRPKPALHGRGYLPARGSRAAAHRDGHTAGHAACLFGDGSRSECPRLRA
jgi:hypothetical protein